MRVVSAVALTLLAALVAAVPTPVDTGFTDTYLLVATNAKPYRYTVRAAALPNERNAVLVERNPNAEGWDYIKFTANTTFLADNTTEAYYAAGYAEGILTTNSIYSSFITAMTEDWPSQTRLDQLVTGNPDTQNWVNAHVAHMRMLAATNTTDYGKQVGYLLRQIDGLYDGYAAGLAAGNWTGMADPPLPLTWQQMFFVSFQSEIGRVSSATTSGGSSSGGESTFESIRDMFPNMARVVSMFSSKKRRTHCSALVKITGDDVFLGHDTWSSYNTMVRQYKVYAMQSTVTMSGYPGSLSSIDDWYMTSNGLAVTETSIAPMNDDLNSHVPASSVSEFMRAMIANYLAQNSSHWVQLFSWQNSGTYNNQYMVLDTTLAKTALGARGDHVDLPANAFWVLEQTPGLVVSRDMTDVLNEQQYWPSYNIPYFKEVFERLGYAPYAAMAPSLFNYSQYSRAVIFAREQSKVQDLATMYQLMRYNEWQTDPASEIRWCVNGSYHCDANRSAFLTIASRGDLAPAPWLYLGPSSVASQVSMALLGAIDSKITSVKMMADPANPIGVAINGPTSQDQPVFNFTALIASNETYWAGINRRGVPEAFNFMPARFLNTNGPLTTSPATMAPTSAPDDGDDTKTKVGIAVGVVAGVSVLGAGGFVAFKRFGRTRYDVAEGEDRPLV